jgi:hypothetical protein
MHSLPGRPLFPRHAAADLQNVAVRASSYAALPSFTWDWRRSAHFRLASLASAWALVLLHGVLGPVIAPIAVARFCFSGAQTWLNIRLGKRQPVGKQDRWDVALLVLIFAGAYTGVGIAHFTGNLMSPLCFLPMLVPFTLLQARMTARSYRAHARFTGEPFEGAARTAVRPPTPIAPRRSHPQRAAEQHDRAAA